MRNITSKKTNLNLRKTNGPYNSIQQKPKSLKFWGGSGSEVGQLVVQTFERAGHLVKRPTH